MDYLNIIKVKLAEKLEKMGSSLEEFENLLNEPQGMEKGASFIKTSSISDAAIEAAKLAALASFLTGSAGGAMAYGLKSHLSKQDDNIGDKQQEIARVNYLTNKLKQEHGLK